MINIPRYQRVQSPSKSYHVMLRGNERKKIFLDDDDKNRFLFTLDRMKGKGNYKLYAYCIMDNHVHLLMAEGEDSLSRTMKRIGVSYAYYFNHKYGRIGHVFQDRFKSEVIDSDFYLISAARYIHNNPVKAGIAKGAGDYEWSSYNTYISDYSPHNGLIEKDQLLGIFSDKREKAVAQLIEFTGDYGEDAFIDCEEDSKKILSNSDIKSIINDIVKKPEGIELIKNCKDKVQRKRILREIKEKTGAPVRELSRILGISKDIIFRA